MLKLPMRGLKRALFPEASMDSSLDSSYSQSPGSVVVSVRAPNALALS